MEDYYNQEHANGKANLELVDIPELRFRKLLREHPLHQYYLDNGMAAPDK